MMNLKIVELGFTGVGKTTYMASMYGALQKEFSGFRLEATGSAEHTRLLNLFSSIKNGTYPFPTEQRNEYDFYLKYNYEKVLRFQWADYRGKAIRETSDNSYEARKLHQDICEADGVIIFFDCRSLEIGDIKANEIRRITTLMGKAFQDLREPISLSIVLTKVDLIRDFQPQFLNPLKGLIKAIEVSPLISGAIIPVACGIRMLNIQLPVLFALQARVRSKVKILNEEFQKYDAKAKEYQAISNDEREKASGILGFFRDVGREIVGKTPHYKLAEYNQEWAEGERAKALAKLNEWKTLADPADALDIYTNKLIKIKSGKSITEYVQQLEYIKSENHWLWGIITVLIMLVFAAIILFSKR